MTFVSVSLQMWMPNASNPKSAGNLLIQINTEEVLINFDLDTFQVVSSASIS